MKTLILIASLISVSTMANNSPTNWKPLPVVRKEIVGKARSCFYRNDFDCIEDLVDKGHDPNFSPNGLENILSAVSYSGIMKAYNDGKPWKRLTSAQARILDLLISKGAIVNRLPSAKTGGTPLYQAIVGNLEAFQIYPVNTIGSAEYLISKGADVNKVSYSRITGWETAWKTLDAKSRFEVFDAIVRGGANFFKYGCETSETSIGADQRYLAKLGIERPLIYEYAWKYYHRSLGAPDWWTDEWAFYDWLELCDSGALQR